MKILAVTVVYEPDPELLLRSVASYVDAVDKVLVWRNSPIPESLEARLAALGENEGKIEFRGDGTNVGISRALNAVWQEVVGSGIDALLTMDQDSIWHHFKDFLNLIETPAAPKGFYAPRILSAQEGEGGGNSPQKSEFTPFETAFTSGMLIPSDILERVGGWCEDFRVDGVDNEFCLHAKTLGIQGYRCPAGWLEHTLGKVEFRTLFGLRFRTYNYTPERLFGIYRNNLLAIKKYPSVSGNFRRQFYRTWLWKRPLRMLLGERNLKEKFAAVRQGIRAAKRAEL
ncbi:MAG: hypothetical protein IKX37_01525 [Bacteroidales bacterium]|nr:hypothetical protein [Bacteroidales bacterium]